jgi:hypothetical protein
MLAPLFYLFLFYLSFFPPIASSLLHASAITMMAPTNSNSHVPPIYNLPYLKKIENDEIALTIYEIIPGTKAHIPVPQQETVFFVVCHFLNETI